jgi:hypothetical protein
MELGASRHDEVRTGTRPIVGQELGIAMLGQSGPFESSGGRPAEKAADKGTDKGTSDADVTCFIWRRNGFSKASLPPSDVRGSSEGEIRFCSRCDGSVSDPGRGIGRSRGEIAGRSMQPGMPLKTRLSRGPTDAQCPVLWVQRGSLSGCGPQGKQNGPGVAFHLHLSPPLAASGSCKAYVQPVLHSRTRAECGQSWVSFATR